MKILIVTHDMADKTVPEAPLELKALVSIFSPPESDVGAWYDDVNCRPCFGFRDFSGDKIALSFDDIDNRMDNLVAPETKDISKLISWCNDVSYDPSGKDRIMFHCHAGISRSTACALTYLTIKLGPGSEEECVEKIWEVRPIAWFNDRIVTIADALLNRNGALVKAVSDWKELRREYR